MARCVGNEKQCRSVFYGAMISESVIALIWAAIAMAFFGGVEQLNNAVIESGGSAAKIVDIISNTTLGKVGAVLAILGVVAAPITSGDTAFRSARLIIADMFSVDQKPILKRFAICTPLFVVGFWLTTQEFDVIWRYFAWFNQSLAVVTLWAIYVWLKRRNKNYWVALIPAIAMTYIASTFTFTSRQFFGLENHTLAYILGGVVAASISFAFIKLHANDKPLKD